MFKPQPDGPSSVNAPAATTQKCGNCCCCVLWCSIENIRFVGDEPKTFGGTTSRNGHAFDLMIGMRFDPGAACDECTLEWWEKIYFPPNVGKWVDQFQENMQSTTFDPWKKRAEICPKGGGQVVKITDFPSLNISKDAIKKAKGQRTRVVEFRLIVRSGGRCNCEKASVMATARQILTFGDDGELTVRQFDVPNPLEKPQKP